MYLITICAEANSGGMEIFMNYVWPGIIIASLIFAAANGTVTDTVTAGLEGAASSITVLLSFAGIMCFWSGILKVAEAGGAAKLFERILSPVIRRLFPKVTDRKSITMNVTANLLGMGNAATPAGIEAMKKLDSENKNSPHPSRAMSRFAVMNTASLQLFPTTVLGLLTAAGAENPYSIIPLIWVCSAVSLVAALLAEAFFCKEGK